MPYTQKYDEQAVVAARGIQALSWTCRELTPYEFGQVERYSRMAEAGGVSDGEAAFMLQCEQGLRESGFWVASWRWQVALVETIQGCCGLVPFVRAEFERLRWGVFRMPPVRFEWVAVLAREMEKLTKELRQRDCLVNLVEPAPLNAQMCFTAIATSAEQQERESASGDPRQMKRARFTSPLPSFDEVYGESPPPAPRAGRVTLQGEVGRARQYSPTAPPYDAPSPETLVRYGQ